MNSIYDTPPAEPSLLLTLVEAARLLAVSQQTLNRWSKQGIIPRIKGKRLIRYRRSDIEAFVNCQQGERTEIQVEKTKRQKVHAEYAQLMGVDVSKLTPAERERHETQLRWAMQVVTEESKINTTLHKSAP